LALSVPLSRFTSRIGGGSAFFVRQRSERGIYFADYGETFWCFVLAVAVHGVGFASVFSTEAKMAAESPFGAWPFFVGVVLQEAAAH